MGEKRFFAHEVRFDLATIKGGDYGHITKVLRMQENDDINVFNPSFGEYEGEIEAIDREGKEVIVRVKKLIKEAETGRPKISAIVSLIKNSPMDSVIEKLTEAGADVIIPYEARRSVVKAKEDRSKKERWEKIVYTAVKQCGRISIPVIKNFIKSPSEADSGEGVLKILVYENEKEKYITDCLEEAKGSGRGVVFAIGPEGGFEEEEALSFIKEGFIPVSLGKNILRAETAAPAVCCMVSMYAGRDNWKAQ